MQMNGFDPDRDIARSKRTTLFKNIDTAVTIVLDDSC